MTTVAQVRKAALVLPEVEEGTHFGMVAFSVKGKGFASITKDSAWLQLQLDPDDVAGVVEEIDGAEPLVRMGTTIGVRVPLSGVDGMRTNALVRRAWLARAPKRLAAAERSAEAAEPGRTGDLPAAIGRPATRALAGAGWTTLAELERHTETEVAALHGVGPKAVRILAEALAERGASFR